MWFLTIIFWLIISALLAYPLANSLEKHYLYDIQLKGSFKSDNIYLKDKPATVKIQLQNLSQQPITITEVGLFYRPWKKHIPFTHDMHKQTLPLTLKQHNKHLFEQLYEDFPLDLEEIERSEVKIYVKDKNNKYTYEVI